MDIQAAVKAVRSELSTLLLGKTVPASATLPAGTITQIVPPDRLQESRLAGLWEVMIEPLAQDDTEGGWASGLTSDIISERDLNALFDRHFGDAK